MCLLCTCVAIISASIVGVLVWYFFFRYNENDLHISNRVITEHEFKTSLKFDIEKKYYKPTDYGRWKYFNHRKRHSTSGVCFTFFATKVYATYYDIFVMD